MQRIPYYRKCAVPRCKNNTVSNPNKLFIEVPRKAEVRKIWYELANRNFEDMSMNSSMYFCEDHFDLPNDMENYMRYHVMGSVKRITLKPGCVPSKFHCQTERKRSSPSPCTSNTTDTKQARLATVQEAIIESELKSQSEAQSTSISMNTLQSDVCEQKTKDISVQALITKKYRSKYTQTTTSKLHDSGTSPCKPLTATVSISTSPFKIEESVEMLKPGPSNISSIRKLVYQSDSDVSSAYNPSTAYHQSSPSVQSLLFKITSDSSSINEEEAKIEKEKEAKKVTEYFLKKIEAKPRLYVGITNECFFLIDLLHKNTQVPIAHILLCLKKIRLNTTFSELADELSISKSYAGKIFLNNVILICDMLKPFIVELNKKNIKRSLPISFRHVYNKVSCIIDCFEIEIEKPSKSVNQALTWSEYKKANTVKYLISCTPNGLVNYISPGYGGRISDTLLVEKCGFLDQLKPGTWILADRGFKHTEQLLIQRQCHLMRPPSVAQGAKLTKAEARKTKQIASLRIHIERVIRRLREFSMLKPHSVVNSFLIRVLDECVIIACALINLQDSLIK